MLYQAYFSITGVLKWFTATSNIWSVFCLIMLGNSLSIYDSWRIYAGNKRYPGALYLVSNEEKHTKLDEKWAEEKNNKLHVANEITR